MVPTVEYCAAGNIRLGKSGELQSWMGGSPSEDHLPINKSRGNLERSRTDSKNRLSNRLCNCRVKKYAGYA